MTEMAPDAGPSQQTPPPQSALDVTPRSGKSHGGTFAQTRLRGAIAQEMVNEILECPVDAFLEHYAPFYPSTQLVNDALNGLKGESQVNDDNSVLALAADFTTPSKDNEPTVFKRLTKIMRVLEKVQGADGRKRSFFYRDCPSNNMTSEIEGTNFKVDACITSSLTARPIILSDVAAIAEFKKASKPEDIEDNRLKLISAATQIMNDDPTRMWVYGITIEHTQMAVWYFCRSHSVKSKSFDFTTDINTFIRVFLSLLYATRPEIGYDPTVSRVNHMGKICYVYEVGTDEVPRYYRTTELIFAARVLCVTGRKTRVWKAVEVAGPLEGQFERQKPGTAPVVLKDGWLDEGSRSEKVTQDLIFKSLDNIQPSDYGWADEYLRDCLSAAFKDKKYKEYFMEILDSRLLGKTKLRHESATPNPNILRFTEPKPIDSLHMLGGTMQSGDHSGTPGNTPSRTPGMKGNFHPREYKAKQQHRLIYRHVGCSLTDTKDLSTSFYAIHDTFIALLLLYLAKWTHRDVSAGNIIAVEIDGSVRGKLSDLEYAKEFSDETFSADPKTGTPYFMPWEIHSSRRVSPTNNRNQRVIQRRNDPFASFDTPDTNRARRQKGRPMKFRFQHDLESLWWVALWILVYRVGGDKALQLARDIFTHSDVPSDERTAFFTEEDDGLSDYIHQDLKSLAVTVLDVRDALIDSYTNEQKTKNLLDHQEYTTIYNKVWAEFSVLIGKAVKVKGVSFHNPKNPKKRPHSETEPGDDNECPTQIPRRQCK